MLLGPTGGLSDTIRAGGTNGVWFGSIWAQALTSTVTLNLQCWEI
jgi:glycogen synthase